MDQKIDGGEIIIKARETLCPFHGKHNAVIILSKLPEELSHLEGEYCCLCLLKGIPKMKGVGDGSTN